MSRRFMDEHGATIERTFARRKNKLTMLCMFGWGFVGRLMLGRLSIAGLEQRASELLGCTVRAVRSNYADLAFDVDDADDLELARRYLSRRPDVKDPSQP